MKNIKTYEDFVNDKKLSVSLPELYEGGSYGHLSHPFEDMSLTFGDMKEICNFPKNRFIQGIYSLYGLNCK
jgi:hypothetical protein